MYKKILVVEDHLPYLRESADRLAKIYKGQDPEELYAEAVLIACEHKHKYNSKYSPTTFLKIQVINRLNNKIQRKFLPSVFKIGSDKIISGNKGQRMFIEFIPIADSNSTFDDDEKETIAHYAYTEDFDAYDINKLREEVRHIVEESGLKETDVQLLYQRFGINSCSEEKVTLKKLAQFNGVKSEEAIRLRINRLKEKLKDNKELMLLAA